MSPDFLARNEAAFRDPAVRRVTAELITNFDMHGK